MEKVMYAIMYKNSDLMDILEDSRGQYWNQTIDEAKEKKVAIENQSDTEYKIVQVNFKEIID